MKSILLVATTLTSLSLLLTGVATASKLDTGRFYAVCSALPGQHEWATGHMSDTCELLNGEYCQDHCTWYVVFPTLPSIHLPTQSSHDEPSVTNETRDCDTVQ